MAQLIDQKTLDACGVAPNPGYNCTLDEAKKVAEFLKNSVEIVGTICINFTTGGPSVAPIIPAEEISPADCTKGEYYFVLVKDYSEENTAPVTTCLAAVQTQLNTPHRLAYDIAVEQYNNWQGTPGVPFNPMVVNTLGTKNIQYVQSLWKG